MNRNRIAILLVLTGLLAAGAAAVVIYLLTTTVRIQPTTQNAPAPTTTIQTKAVVIAVTDIAPNTIITNSQVTTGTYPADLVPADALTSVSQVVSTTSKVAIFSGQILLQRQFVASGGRTGASINIPPGKVLVAFPATDMLNATGAVQAGDRVDVLLSIPISGTTRLDSGSLGTTQAEIGKRDLVAQATLQNVEVYSIGYWSPPGQQQPSAREQNTLKVITFVVDHQEALILKFVKDSGGTIDLAVRSAADAQNVQTDPVTLDYLVDLFGFIGLSQPQTP